MKQYKKIIAPTMQELFLQQMMESFLSGEVKPGEKLPSERTLGEQMGVSKTVAHHGLKELERMGFVKIKPQSGVYAVDYMRNGNLDTFTAITRYSTDTISFELIESFTDILLAIDNMAFQRFVEQPGDKRQAISALNHQVERIGIDLTDLNLTVESKAKTVVQFFYQIGLLSGRPAFPLMMNTLQAPAEIVLENCIRATPPEIFINTADSIVRALEENNAEQAYSILVNTEEQCLKNIKHKMS